MRTCVLAVLAALLSVGCGSDGPPGAVPGGDAATTAAPVVTDRTAPLDRLPPCEGELPPSAVDGGIEGLLVPDGTVLTAVEETDPLVQVTGVIPMDPVEVRAFYADAPDLEALAIEDEILEAEGLMQGRTHRFFFKAQAQCRTRSTAIFVVAPRNDDAPLPQPSGGG